MFPGLENYTLISRQSRGQRIDARVGLKTTLTLQGRAGEQAGMSGIDGTRISCLLPISLTGKPKQHYRRTTSTPFKMTRSGFLEGQLGALAALFARHVPSPLKLLEPLEPVWKRD